MIGTAFSLLVVLVGISLPVAVALGLMAYVLSERYAFFPMTGAIGELAWNSSNDFILIAAPMFIMMGELMHRSGMSERLFAALTPWFARIPGRLIHTNIEWLAQGSTAFPMQILIGILVSIPFTTTIFLGGLSSVPDELYDAAAVEGAGRWQQFRHITLPLLRPFINIALVLNVIYVFNSFPIIWVTTQGGPANSTDILVTYLYKLAFRLGKFGEAAAVSIIMFALLLVFAVIYVRLAMREEEQA